jgi:hypothetical protein
MPSVKSKFNLEVEYLFDKTQTSWYYVTQECADFATAVKGAEKLFKTLLIDSGWEKKASIVAIRLRQHGKETPITKTVTPAVLPPARSKGRCVSTNTGLSTVSDTATVSTTGDTEKPAGNRKTTGGVKRKTDNSLSSSRTRAATTKRRSSTNRTSAGNGTE